MDLKRAWRNGFLVSLIFAIPLSDLYYNQYSNLLGDNGATKPRVQRTAAGLADGTNENIGGAATSWDNSVDENGPTIPVSAVTALLLESGDTDFSDIQKTAIQFDPQEIFQSERIEEVDLDSYGSFGQNTDDDFGPLASLSYGFGNPSGSAPGFGGTFTPSMFAPGGRSVSAEALFIDPLAETSTQTEPDDESLHNVPEPSSFVLIAIGTISVASLLYRKSKSPIPHS
jgi:hypothetical protein